MRRALGMLVLLVACGSSSTATTHDAGPACTPGAVTACSCTNAGMGRSTCTTDALRGGCDCSEPEPDPPPVVTDDDAGDLDAGVDAADAALPGFGDPCIGACQTEDCQGNCDDIPNVSKVICWHDDTDGTVNMKGRCTFGCTGGDDQPTKECAKFGGGCDPPKSGQSGPSICHEN